MAEHGNSSSRDADAAGAGRSARSSSGVVAGGVAGGGPDSPPAVLASVNRHPNHRRAAATTTTAPLPAAAAAAAVVATVAVIMEPVYVVTLAALAGLLAVVVLVVLLYRYCCCCRREEYDLTGHVALITGAGGGFGRQLALQLAARGCRLACVDVASRPNEETVALVLAEQGEERKKGAAASPGLGLGARAYTADLTKAEEIRDLVERVIQDFGCVDMLVSNAGQLQGGAVWELSEEQADRVLDVNLRATLLLVRALVPHMRARRRGHLVAVSSISASIHVQQLAVYAATKAGLSHFMACLYHDLADQGLQEDIHVTTLEPYFMSTYHALSHAVIVRGWLGRLLLGFLDPAEAAAQAVRAIAQRRHRVTLPAYMGCSWFFFRALPLPLVARAVRWLAPPGRTVQPLIPYELRHHEDSAEYLHALLSKGYPLLLQQPQGKKGEEAVAVAAVDPEAVCRRLVEALALRGEPLPFDDFPRYADSIEAFYEARGARGVPDAVRAVFFPPADQGAAAAAEDGSAATTATPVDAFQGGDGNHAGVPPV